MPELKKVLLEATDTTRMQNNSIKILGTEDFCEIRIIKETHIKYLYEFFRLLEQFHETSDNHFIVSTYTFFCRGGSGSQASNQQCYRG